MGGGGLSISGNFFFGCFGRGVFFLLLVWSPLSTVVINLRQPSILWKDLKGFRVEIGVGLHLG